MPEQDKSAYVAMVNRNLEIVESLSPSSYAYLYEFLNAYKKSIKRYLVCLLGDMKIAERSNYAAYSYEDGISVGWIYDSVKYLSSRHGGGNWHRNTILLHKMGLIIRLRPDENTAISDSMRTSIQRAAETGQRVIAWYTCMPYTDELLQRAERAARQLMTSGIKLGAFTKTSFIKVWGYREANKYYYDKRKIPILTKVIEAEIIRQTRFLVKTNGYAFKGNIETAVKEAVLWRAGLPSVEEVFGYNRDSLEWKKFKKINKELNAVWKRNGMKLLKDAGFSYKLPNKDQIETLPGIHGDRYIVTRKPRP